MKYFLALACFIITLTPVKAQHQGPINWLTIEQADSLNQINPKPFFIDVYTSWCGWCKRMDAGTFQDPNIAAYLNQFFYPVKLDAEIGDSLYFNGKKWGNSQRAKADSILAIYQAEVQLLKDSIQAETNDLNEKKENLLSIAKFYEAEYKELTFIQPKTDSASKEELNRVKNAVKAIKKLKPNFIKEPHFLAAQKKLKQKDLSGFKAQIDAIGAENQLYKDSAQTLQKAFDLAHKPILNEIRQKENQIQNFIRKTRKTTHDLAIDLCRGQMSYPTFILLFNNLEANLPLKGYKQPLELLSYLAFVHEGAWRYTYNVGNYSQLFQETFAPSAGAPVNFIPWVDFETAQKRAAKDGKKIFVQVFNQNSMTGTITDRKTLQNPSTVEYLKKHYHCVKLDLYEQDSITYKGRVFKNVGGYHQLALLFSDNQITSPMLIFLDADGNRISKVSDYFEMGEIDIVLAFFHEEAYVKGIQFSDFKKSKLSQVKQ